LGVWLVGGLIDSRTAPLKKQATFESPVFFAWRKVFVSSPILFLAAGSSIGIFLSIPFHALNWHGQRRPVRPVSEVTDFRIRQQRKEEANGSSKWNE
jgi:hypothetical protein